MNTFQESKAQRSTLNLILIVVHTESDNCSSWIEFGGIYMMLKN